MKKIDLNKILKKFKIKHDDNIMIHGDIGAINQLDFSPRDRIEDKLSKFYKLLLQKYNFNGTLLIPTFTWKFCRKKIFNVEKSQSELGLFSELSRKIKFGKRTSHPIYSFKLFGNNLKYFLNSSINTCFGKNSIFEKFVELNGKIMCIGCNFNSITLIHYIEVLNRVSYRYDKNFYGKIIRENKIYNTHVTYTVKKKKFMKSKNYFKKHDKMSSDLYKNMVKNKKMIESDFGRYNSLIVDSNEMLKYGKRNLLKSEIFNLK